jgi:hypothetical protein
MKRVAASAHGVRPRAWRHAGEPAPAHADNRIRITVDPNDLADNCRIAAELSLPVFVAEDGDRRAGIAAVSSDPISLPRYGVASSAL